MDSEVYDAATDVLVEDLVFIAINKETGLTIEVPFCHLYPYEGDRYLSQRPSIQQRIPQCSACRTI